MSDVPPPPTPLKPMSGASSPPVRGDLKDVSRTLKDLTDPEGPIVQLVMEVRDSNVLAKSNQKDLRYTLVALFILFCGVFYSLYLVNRTTNTVVELQQEQAALAKAQDEFAHSTLEKLQATQSAVSEAPKIVANDKGELVVMATVQLTPNAAEVAAAEVVTPKKPARSRRLARKKKRKKSAMRVVDDLLDAPAAEASAPARDEDEPAAAKPKQVVAIPLHTDEASYGATAD